MSKINKKAIDAELTSSEEEVPQKKGKAVDTKKPKKAKEESEESSDDNDISVLKSKTQRKGSDKAKAPVKKQKISEDKAEIKPKVVPAKKAPVKNVESDEEDSDDEEPKKTPAKVAPAAKLVPVKKAQVKQEESSDEEDSDDNVKPIKAPAKVIPAAKLVPAKKAQVKQEESSDEEDSDDDVKPKKMPAAKVVPAKKGQTKKVESSGEEDSDDEEEDVKPKKVIPAAKLVPATKVSTKREDSSDEDEEEDEKEEVSKPKTASAKKATGKKEEPSEEEDEDEKEKPQKPKAQAKLPENAYEELFVRNLSYNTTNESLADYMGKYGEIEVVKILSDKMTGKSKGFGFVKFFEKASAVAAMNDAGNINVDGRDIQIRYSNDDSQRQNKDNFNNRGGNFQKSNYAGEKHAIFVGNLSFKTNENNIKRFFSDCGNVIDVRIAKQPDGKMKGFAHVDFDSKEAVDNALKKDGVDFEGRTLKVDKSTPRQGGGSFGGSSFRGGRSGFNRGGFGGNDSVAKAKKTGAMLMPTESKAVDLEDDDE